MRTGTRVRGLLQRTEPARGAQWRREPMAARIDPLRVGARHQALRRLVAQAAWSYMRLLRVSAGVQNPSSSIASTPGAPWTTVSARPDAPVSTWSA